MSISVMKRLTVIAPINQADMLVRRLMKLKCVEISTSQPDDDGELLRHDTDTERVEAERRVDKVAQALPYLETYSVQRSKWRDTPLRTEKGYFAKTGSYHAAWAVVDEVLEIKAQMTALQETDRRLEDKCAMLMPWLGYDHALDVQETETCRLWYGSLPPDTMISSVAAALNDTCASLEEVWREKSGLFITVLFHKSEETQVNAALVPLGFVRLPMENVAGTAKNAFAELGKEMDETDIAIQKCVDRLNHLSQLIDDLKMLYDMENTTLLAAKHRQKLVSTQSCVLLEGWVPEARCQKVSQTLGKLDCAYDIREPSEEEEPPVLLKNNGYASNFEWVVGMYSYPKYGSYDPTFIMSIYYFIIFGLMFADVGYGLLVMLGGFLAPKFLKLSPGMKRSFHMFGYCGIACTILGVVFGGWFGDLPYALMTGFFGYESAEAAKAAIPFFNGVVLTLGGEPLVLNPVENPIPFLIISLAIGVVHIIGGMAVKFYVLCKQGDILGAIFDVGSYWVLFAGIGLIFVNSTVGLVLTIAGVAMIVLTQGRHKKNIFAKFIFGLKGLYDLISYASDLLSYSRILALGLAAGVMAQVFNLLATMGGPTVPGFILMVVVMLVGHGLNMAINLLGAFVHTCRLQYLEFFNKFYEDGGVPFDPALPCEKYSTADSDTSDQ